MSSPSSSIGLRGWHRRACRSPPRQPAHAQWIVFDPTNYAQNVLTAARELQQVNNEIQSLQNQATSLINQAQAISRACPIPR